MTAIQPETVRVGEDGQVTLPDEARRILGLKPGDLVTVHSTTGGIVLRPAAREATQGSLWLKELYDYFAPVREEAIERGYTGDEINDAINEAVAAVRRERGKRGKRG